MQVCSPSQCLSSNSFLILFFLLMKSSLLFISWRLCLLLYPIRHHSYPGHISFLYIIFLSFIVFLFVCFTFRFMVHFKLVFVRLVKYVSCLLYFLHVDVIIPAPFLENTIFLTLHCIAFDPSSKIIDYIYKSFFWALYLDLFICVSIL